jgi:hypothetical protein
MKKTAVNNFLALIVLALPQFAVAQNRSWDVSGYLKYLYSNSNRSSYPDPLNDHLIHGRLNTRWYPSDWLTFAAGLRVRAWYGSSVGTDPGFTNQLKSDYSIHGLDGELWYSRDSKTRGYAELDRFYLDMNRGNVQVTAGRQRVAWGTSLVWNVIDLFNPMSILDFDYEERPGADAVRLQYYTGAVSHVEIVAKPSRDKYKATYAGLGAANTHGYDFFILGARQNNRFVLGGAWSGHIHGAGFRGELKLSEPPSHGRPTGFPLPVNIFRDLTGDTQVAFSAVLSADYAFSNTLYIHTEALFNRNGRTKDIGMYWPQINEVGLLSPSRWSLFQEVAYDFHPLVRGDVFVLYNPLDNSFLAAPSISWNMLANLDVMVIAFIAEGNERAEFGDFGTTSFLCFKFAF